jgi:hypothetical protein
MVGSFELNVMVSHELLGLRSVHVRPKFYFPSHRIFFFLVFVVAKARP